MKGGKFMQKITLEDIFNTLLQFKEETNKHFSKIDEHLDIVDIRLDKIDTHLNIVDTRLDKIDTHLNIVDTRLDKIDAHLNIVDTRLDDHDAQFISLGNIITKMEYEHGKKLDLLLDYAKATMEKHEQYDKSLSQIDAKLFNHDIRINILENKLRRNFIVKK